MILEPLLSEMHFFVSLLSASVAFTRLIPSTQILCAVSVYFCSLSLSLTRLFLFFLSSDGGNVCSWGLGQEVSQTFFQFDFCHERQRKNQQYTTATLTPQKHTVHLYLSLPPPLCLTHIHKPLNVLLSEIKELFGLYLPLRP